MRPLALSWDVVATRAEEMMACYLIFTLISQQEAGGDRAESP